MSHVATVVSRNRILPGLAVALLVTALAGCSISSTGPTTSMSLFDSMSRTRNAEAFGADKVFGIVSITADPYILKVGGDSSISGALSAMSSEKGYFGDPDRVLAKSVPIVVGYLSKTNNYLMLPPNNIVTQSDYLTIDESSNNMFNTKITARGYRKISDKGNLAMSAQILGLDAALHVNINFGYTTDAVNIAQVVEFGEYYATVKVDVLAVDESGHVVWRESRASVSPQPVEANTQVGDAANFAKLEPFLIQSLRTTMDNIMKELDKG